MRAIMMLGILACLLLSVHMRTASAQSILYGNVVKLSAARTNNKPLGKMTNAQKKARIKTITAAIDKAMQYVKGKESQGSTQYNDNVVDFGLTLVKRFPQYKNTLESYKKWVIENDAYIEGYPYWSIRHVMTLSSIGEDKKALEIFAKLKPAANDGKWETSYHIGYYLYGCVIDKDLVLLDKTLKYLNETIVKEPDVFHYFTAYCVWKAFERTKDKKYKSLFLTIVKTLKPFKDQYISMAATDGHMGEVMCVLATAYTLTHEETYRDICTKMVDPLLKLQAKDGSWNDNAGYSIMPATGFALYLSIL